MASPSAALTPALAVALRLAREVLGRHGVPFALAGGLAVNIWGRSRATSDIDFAVFVESFDALRELVDVAQPAGFLALSPEPMKFPRAWLGRLLVDPDLTSVTCEPVVVDLLCPAGRGGRTWARELLERAVVVDLLGEATPVVRPEDLVLFKLLVEHDRGYDMEDARSVVAQAGERLDREYLARQALRLGVRVKLRQLGI